MSTKHLSDNFNSTDAYFPISSHNHVRF